MSELFLKSIRRDLAAGVICNIFKVNNNHRQARCQQITYYFNWFNTFIATFCCFNIRQKKEMFEHRNYFEHLFRPLVFSIAWAWRFLVSKFHEVRYERRKHPDQSLFSKSKVSSPILLFSEITTLYWVFKNTSRIMVDYCKIVKI